MQSWQYIRLTVYFDNDRLVSVLSNIGTVYSDRMPSERHIKRDRNWLDNYFAELGREGWELTSSLSKGGGASEIHYFKRPIE